MQRASRTGRQALNEMRRLLGVLREENGPQAFAPQPGLGEIDALVDQVRATGLPVRWIGVRDGIASADPRNADNPRVVVAVIGPPRSWRGR